MQLFCYGTLQFPVVLHRVTGRRLRGAPARLDDYACYGVRGEAFPGIRAQPGAVTPGVLYRGLSRAQLARLDAWETDLYERVAVHVRDRAGRRLPAWTYVIGTRHADRLDGGHWNAEAFRAHDLSRFLRQRC